MTDKEREKGPRDKKDCTMGMRECFYREVQSRRNGSSLQPRWVCRRERQVDKPDWTRRM